MYISTVNFLHALFVEEAEELEAPRKECDGEAEAGVAVSNFHLMQTRAKNYTMAELGVLMNEYEKRAEEIKKNKGQIPWEEIASLVTAVQGLHRTPEQCKKKVWSVISENRRKSMGNDSGKSRVQCRILPAFAHVSHVPCSIFYCI
jgi:hypothetical protein